MRRGMVCRLRVLWHPGLGRRPADPSRRLILKPVRPPVWVCQGPRWGQGTQMRARPPRRRWPAALGLWPAGDLGRRVPELASARGRGGWGAAARGAAERRAAKREAIQSVAGATAQITPSRSSRPAAPEQVDLPHWGAPVSVGHRMRPNMTTTDAALQTDSPPPPTSPIRTMPRANGQAAVPDLGDLHDAPSHGHAAIPGLSNPHDAPSHGHAAIPGLSNPHNALSQRPRRRPCPRPARCPEPNRPSRGWRC